MAWLLNALKWIWDRTIVSTFLAGLLVLLPLTLTVMVMAWLAGIVRERLGPESLIGRGLQQLGLQFVTNDLVASAIGWTIVIAGLWALGVLIRAIGRQRIQRSANRMLEQIPVFGTIYRPIAQVVDMMKLDKEEELKGMQVVYCEFGNPGAVGFLGLLTDETVYRFRNQDCHLIYVPTAPVPMTGCLMFVSVDGIERIEMSPEHLLRIFFSVGGLATNTVPQQHINNSTDSDSK